MKKFYIYIEEIEGFSSADFSCMAENKEEAVTKYLEYIKEHKNDKDYYGYIFDEDDRWRLFANEDSDYVNTYNEWERRCKEEEILWSRPIEL